jgi:hypothetical protein
VRSANLDLVSSIIEDWERGDYGSAEWADPNIEFVFADGPAPGRWIGPAGMAAANRDWLSAWEDVRQEVDGYRELDDERVLVLHRFSASGKVSGLHTEQIRADGAALLQLSRGKVVRLVHYFDRERALADIDPGAHSPSA